MDANEFIERAEREAGQRVDDNDGDNNAMAFLIGALAREMGKRRHSSKDDMAAGLLLRHQMTPEYKRQQASKRLLADLLSSGMSPDDLKDLGE